MTVGRKVDQPHVVCPVKGEKFRFLTNQVEDRSQQSFTQCQIVEEVTVTVQRCIACFSWGSNTLIRKARDV